MQWENDCGAVSWPKYSIQTCVVTFDTAKPFLILRETLFKRFNFTAYKAELSVE